MSAHLTARLVLGKVAVSDRPLRVPVNAPAPPLSAGAHMHQVVPATVADAVRKLNQAVPVPVPHTARWKVCQVGDRWGAFQSWAGPVYWLRLFDTFQLATEFVRDATAKAARVA